ncbi:MAG: elongation factor G [Ruminococcaceae bacterium]|nr:elongation factor G [Oscillospiraceae bacterium]
MATFTTKQIRNVCLLGHSGSGKTMIAEAILYFTKNIDRMGNPTNGNTVCDYDAEEIKRGFTLQSSLINVNWSDMKINVLDTPGYFDFAGEMLQALRVSDAAVIALDARAGLEVGAEIAWDNATEANIPKSFFINKFDDSEANFDRTFGELKDRFGTEVCPVLVPMVSGGQIKGFLSLINMKAYKYDEKGNRSETEIPADFMDKAKSYRESFCEAIAVTSDDLMEKFFAGEDFTDEEAYEALHEGIINGLVAPVFSGSATKLWGIGVLLDTIAGSFPRHTAKGSERIVEDGKIIEKKIVTEGDPEIFVFKTIADPFVGKMSFFKVMAGELKNDMALMNIRTGTTEKMAHFYTMKGKKQEELTAMSCGDIGMIAKLGDTKTNDTLALNGDAKAYAPVVYPEAFYTKAVSPKAKGDEDKLSGGFAKILEEDSTLKYENNAETKQLLLSGLGDIHIDVVVSKLKNKYGTGVELGDPKIAYRETIKKPVDVEGKHKKQSGGSGQYGHVKIKFAPGEDEGLTFTQSVVGGSVPKNYYPAVEKGLQEAMVKGVLAGYPVVNLAADLYDGSYHPVDSNEISFKLAARLAYKEGLPKANPVILEPVMTLTVKVPESCLGDAMGDVTKRRGRVLGMAAMENKPGYQMLEAEVPMSEMMDYTIALRAMTQGKGSYSMVFARYEEVPANISQKIIAEAKIEDDE